MATILIAEDEPEAAALIQETVEELGHAALTVGNGKHAIDALQHRNDIRLVITDMCMPEADGRALIEWIRRQMQYRFLPVLILSGYVGPKEIADLLAHGATAFLPKPARRADICEYVNRYVEL